MIAGGELLAAISFGMTCLAMLPQWLQAHQKFRKWQVAAKIAAIATGVINVLLWAVAMTRAHAYQSDPWTASLKYVWLPLGPAGLACLAVYVERTLGKDAASIEQLRRTSYNFKKA